MIIMKYFKPITANSRKLFKLKYLIITRSKRTIMRTTMNCVIESFEKKDAPFEKIHNPLELKIM